MAWEDHWVNAYCPWIARASTCTKFADASNHILHSVNMKSMLMRCAGGGQAAKEKALSAENQAH